MRVRSGEHAQCMISVFRVLGRRRESEKESENTRLSRFFMALVRVFPRSPQCPRPGSVREVRWADGALAVALARSRDGRRRADVRGGMFAPRPLRRGGDGRARLERRRRTRRGRRRGNRAGGGRRERERLGGVSRVPARVQSGTVLRLLSERRALHVGRGMLRRRVQRRPHVRKLRRSMHRRQRGVHEHTRLVLSRNDVLGRARQPLQRVHGSRRELQSRHGLLQREVRYR